ncbi:MULTISPECIES: helix-turn-helix domain-containing protein [unclassified Pseudoclavibacter]|uniref:helix-turn-helix domain-containing protein n=1 Tax=unclassified Pseudoclavibacter TaxID=2615177 RepID=UPI001BA87143|nr:helix-turn-helix domain-containing protein [Pseudoclavibacter sp. Marseille-Q4354]MBS3180015.1 helix-turn-helix domain-containing protein [Pseudoclavibacter sp. Marseille-Q4354]
MTTTSSTTGAPEELFVTLEEAAELLRVDPSTLYRQARKGTGLLNAFKIGRQWRFPVAALEAKAGRPLAELRPGKPAMTSA